MALGLYLKIPDPQHQEEAAQQGVEGRTLAQQLADSRQAAEENHYRRFRLSDAEKAYRQWLALSPNDADAHLGFANLLATCARRHEAVPHYLQLIRQGSVSDFLMLLAKEDGVIVDMETLRKAREADNTDPAPLLGLAWHAAESGDRRTAEELLDEATRLSPEFIPAQIALASLWVEMERWSDFLNWSARLSGDAERFPQLWILRGKAAEHSGEIPGAIRCYGEALRRAPESRQANAAIARLLAQTGNVQVANAFSDYSLKLQQLGALQDRLFFSNQPNDLDSLLELIDRYEQLGRLWEALGWCQVAFDVEPNDPRIRQYGIRVSEKAKGIALKLTDISATPVSFLDLESFPMPNFAANSLDLPASNSIIAGQDSAQTQRGSTPWFIEDQQAVGLEFQYFNGAPGEPQHRMYEFSGGGIGVIDYDLDSFPDAYFTQGCHWPPHSAETVYRDLLFRNQSGKRFAQADNAFPVANHGFGQGVTVGDYDGDGFPDLYVANIGKNQLFRNNGDGTFSDITAPANLSGSGWTTSCVMVDLNGDSLPDIYDVNYVQGADLFERVCVADDGKRAICMPFDFDAAPDSVWLNDGTGRFIPAAATAANTHQPGKGLGVLAFRQSTPELSLFVANDTTPNFLLSPDMDPTSGFRLIERGILMGLALNATGKAEGSMGIAAGDIDNNGLVDFVVTNFLNESNAVYLQQPQTGFTERSQTIGMADASFQLLGFGAQFLDANLDGNLELFVANGHIDDLRRLGKDYEMRAQLFAYTNGKFQEYRPEEIGPYFQNRWLGRSVAKIDWNRDGKEDLLVGHLRSPSRLLTNATENAGNRLTIRLVGVQSSRDAIGTLVKVHHQSQTAVFQLMAGDGYQASNQRHLTIGLGNTNFVDKLDVQWPSGKTQSLSNVTVNQELLIVEGRDAYGNGASDR